MPSAKAAPGRPASAATPRDRARIKVQVYLDDEIALGPGKRQLLELIERHGSISAAARAMGVSYRRAWVMVDTMNRCFRESLVQAGKGGAQGGGATLTPFGQAIRDRFAALEATLAAAAAEELAHLRKQLRRKRAG